MGRRCVRRSHKQALAEWFYAEADLQALPIPERNYHIAPSTLQPIIRENRETQRSEMGPRPVGSCPVLHTGSERAAASEHNQRPWGDNRNLTHMERTCKKEAVPRPRFGRL